MQLSSVTTSLAVASTMLAAAAHADLPSCARVSPAADRLACYDALARTGLMHAPADTPAALTPGPALAASAATAASSEASSSAAPAPTAIGDSPPAEPDGLDARWELGPDGKHGTFRLMPHRPLYALAHATDRTNPNPQSPTRSSDTASPIDLQHVDAKLQLSFKTKLAQDIGGSAADLWFGYTQQSYWQAINSRYSSPFRESNYEPEAILIHPLGVSLGPIRAAYASVALNHQSNGQGGMLSRSWNRVIGDVALESGPFSLQLRPWVRLDASANAHDDNPDIEDFSGRGELIAAYRAGRHVVTVRGRHSLRSGTRSHGTAQFDWAYRLAGTLNAHLQVFSGYGESLIDYNQRQTTVGVGVSFFD